MKIDISGNWKWADAPEKGIITSQPEPPKMGNLFSQSLVLPEGEYRLIILYKEECDHLPGKAYFHRGAFFPIEINGQRYDINFRRMLEKKDYEASIKFIHTGGELTLSAYVQDTFFFNSTIIETPGDYGLHHFIGDRLGTLRLSFADGEEDIPLIMGFNVWYGMPWDLLWDKTAILQILLRR